MNAIAQCAEAQTRRQPARVRTHACCDHYDALLRRLLATHNGTPAAHVIGITSCARGTGVSTIAANLAIRAADQATGSVLLIDANLRHPAMQKLFQVERGHGLSEAISATASTLDCVQPTQVEGLYLMQAGGSAPAMGESVNVAQCFASLRRQFPLIVVDLPLIDELSPCWDSIGQLNGIVLVIEAEKTRRESAQRVIKQLAEAQASLLGVVFNKRRTYIPDWLYRRL